MKHPIPFKALDDRLGFIGTSGSGKTYNAGTAIEILLSDHRGARVVIIDPLGVWWGLRLLADGKKPSNFNIVIFGGDHADLPLNEQAGALIGETAATMAESCIIDLSKLPSRSAERRFMVAFLETIYRKAGGDPFHLIVDEADLFAPQKPQAGDEVLLGHMENIVRRGRVRGFIPWLISQRPAVLNKNVLSQIDGLLAFKLTASHDRDALDAWIEGQADKAQAKEIKDSLPTYQVGEGLVWLPGHGILERRKFPTKVTFDSSRKPKRGETLKSRKLKPLDVSKLKDQLASVVQDAKANDPKELKKQVADLTAQIAKAAKASPAKPVIDKDAIAAAEKRGFDQAQKKLTAATEREVQKRTAEMLSGLGERLQPLMEFLAERGRAIKANRIDLGIEFTAPVVAAPAAAVYRAPPPRPRPAAADGSASAIGNSEQRIVDAIRWWNVLGIPAPSHAQTAFIAGYSHKSGTWSTYLSRLRSAGMIEGRGDLVLTEQGAAIAAEPTAPPSTEALHSAVLEKIDAPLKKILVPLLAAYPNALSHGEAGEAAGYSPSSGTWSTYLSRLRSLDLISGRGELKAEPWLFAA